MITLIAGTFVLSIVHALIPNHWLPLVAVAKSENWQKSELLNISWIIALAHVTGTLIIGILLGVVGWRISEQFESFIHIVAPLLLILLGLIYITLNSPHHHHPGTDDIRQYRKGKRRWILYLVFLMLISPCLEVETFFLSAGAYGLSNVILLASIYAIGSILSIVLLIQLAYKGSLLINNNFIEHNEKKISGIVLMITGFLSFFFH